MEQPSANGAPSCSTKIAGGVRSVEALRLLGVAMSLSPAFGVIGILHAVFVIAVAVLAVYALVLTIVFLRLRITELKRASRSEEG